MDNRMDCKLQRKCILVEDSAAVRSDRCVRRTNDICDKLVNGYENYIIWFDYELTAQYIQSTN